MPLYQQQTPAARRLQRLTWLGLFMWFLYAVISVLSPQFEYGCLPSNQPIRLVVFLFSANFGLYLWAVRIGVHLRRTAGLTSLIMSFAIAYRALLVFTPPILEVDIYRYLWDGQVTVSGANPFRYSPATVRGSISPADADLQHLLTLRKSRAADEVLARVHFPELTTVYPPVSQVVFALAAGSSPSDADVVTLRLILKAWLLAFDIGTILVLAALLSQLRMAPGWLVAYAWCPLVLKEFANSGHLDTIAVFWMMAAIAAVVRGVFTHRELSHSRRFLWCCLGVICLGLGVGAKLFPVILAPLFAAAIWRKLGAMTVMWCGLLFVATGVASLSPWIFLPMNGPNPFQAGNRQAIFDTPARTEATPTSPFIQLRPETLEDEQNREPETSPGLPQHSGAPMLGHDRPSAGLTAFLSHWKMNDFLFLLLEANLSPGSPAEIAGPWFVIVPESWRQALSEFVSGLTHQPVEQSGFFLARALTLGLFCGLGWSWTLQAGQARSGRRWCSCAFLTLAWFWLLSPTLNPWYWTWSIPLLPFVRGRSWWLMSGLIFVYYLRFWCGAHWLEPGVCGTVYAGHQFFDYVLVWFEFGPWLGLLFWETRQRQD